MYELETTEVCFTSKKGLKVSAETITDKPTVKVQAKGKEGSWSWLQGAVERRCSNPPNKMFAV